MPGLWFYAVGDPLYFLFVVGEGAHAMKKPKRYVSGEEPLARMATLAQFISRPVPHNAFLGIPPKKRGNGSQKRAHQIDRIADMKSRTRKEHGNS